MKTLRGIPVSPGYAEGTAYVYRQDADGAVPRYQIGGEQVGSEQRRLHQAMERCAEELRDLRDRVVSELGRAEAGIFDAHLAMLDDKAFRAKVGSRIEKDLVNVEQAVDAEFSDLAKILEEIENEYVRERAQDMRDVKRRVLRHLGHGPAESLAELPPGCVLVTTGLLPSDTLHLDRSHVAAIVMEHGGITGHAAILARSLGIPAVTGLAGATSDIPDGAHVLVDGQSGEVVVAPLAEQQRLFESSREGYEHGMAEAAARQGPCATRDGIAVALYANIGRPEEADAASVKRLDGVGLFRTEYLFLGHSQAPSEQEQTDAYRRVAQAIAPRPVVIRTLDLGGDKKPMFLRHLFEANPNLGLRGLRFSLWQNDLLATQLRAVAAAARSGNVRVLFPMVLGEEDFLEAAERFRAICRESGVESTPPVGAMIETPSAFLMLERIARHADFLSVGTNDLIQFMLAADRNTARGVDDEVTLHPAVVLALKQIAETAGRIGREACVCGEMAGDPAISCLLVGLGFRSLSVSPIRAGKVRAAIKSASLGELTTMAERALACRNSAEVRKEVQSRLQAEAVWQEVSPMHENIATEGTG